MFYLILLDSTLILDLFLTIPFMELVLYIYIFSNIFISLSCFCPKACFGIFLFYIVCSFIFVEA